MSASTLATVTASTKRAPAAVSSVIAAPVENLASVMITPFQALNAELAHDVTIHDPSESKACHAFGAAATNVLPDIVEGDVLVVGGVDYAIIAVHEFNRDSYGSYMRIIVQQGKL